MEGRKRKAVLSEETEVRTLSWYEYVVRGEEEECIESRSRCP